jgi:hypothetical protein
VDAERHVAGRAELEQAGGMLLVRDQQVAVAQQQHPLRLELVVVAHAGQLAHRVLVEPDAGVGGEAPARPSRLVHDDDAGGALGQDQNLTGGVPGEPLEVRPAVWRRGIAGVPALGDGRPARRHPQREQRRRLVPDGEQLAGGADRLPARRQPRQLVDAAAVVLDDLQLPRAHPV